MQKKINTEFTRASDEKCTSESVPPDKWQDEHVNNEMSTGTTFYTLLHFWSISVLCFSCGVEGIVYFRWTFQVFRGVVQKSFQSIDFEKTIAPHLWSHGKISWNLQNVYNCEALDKHPFTVEERFVVGWLVCVYWKIAMFHPFIFQDIWNGKVRFNSSYKNKIMLGIVWRISGITLCFIFNSLTF